MIKEKYYVKKRLKFLEVLGQNLVLLTNLRLEHLLLVVFFFFKEASIISSTNQTSVTWKKHKLNIIVEIQFA